MLLLTISEKEGFEMKKLFLLSVFILVSANIAYAQSINPGDVGSPECREIQLEAIKAVESGGPYKTSGARVKVAAKVVSNAQNALQITSECSSCIMNQFAREYPLKTQTMRL